MGCARARCGDDWPLFGIFRTKVANCVRMILFRLFEPTHFLPESMRALQQAAGGALSWPPPPSPLPSPPLPSPPPPPSPPSLLFRLGTAALDKEVAAMRSPKPMDGSADKEEDSHLEVVVEEPAPA